MSRHLPTHPNLEHLKKQAKELLADMRRANPGCKLADALHALANQYGFSSWPLLKAHVEASPLGGDPVPVHEHPFTGVWRANVAKSKRHPENLFQSATLQFGVNGDAVTITDVVVDAAGREERTTNVLQADGKACPHPHGYVVTARWLGRRVLEAVVTKNGEPEGRVAYAVSPDRKTLILSAGEQTSVFDRIDSRELGRP
jgi:hypothetical protein